MDEVVYTYDEPFQKTALIAKNYSLYSRMSPGWHPNALHIASSVENLIALMCPFLILERLTLATPTFSASSLSDIFLSAITLSSLKIIGIIPSSERLVRLLLELLSVGEDVGEKHNDQEDKDEAKVNIVVKLHF